jgi:hypothetical protein
MSATQRKRRDDPRIKHPGKPLSTRAPGELFPVVFVDISEARCGPRVRPDDFPPEPNHPSHESRMRRPHLEKQAYVFNPDQAAQAAAQWSASTVPSEDRPWLKSWYFPMDAFDPWPTKTDLRCWWCTHPFSWTPFPLPHRWDPHNGRYDVCGFFCGPSCAKAYASGKFPNASSVFGWIEIIAHDFYGYTTATGGTPMIKPAPSRELLREYCGPKGLTIKQFRSVCVHGRTMTMCRPNWVTTKQIVEAEDYNARLVTKREEATDLVNVAPQSAYHSENPDIIQTTSDLVKVTRIPFAGTGARRLDEYFTSKQKLKK